MKNIMIVMLMALAFTTTASAQESNKDCHTSICCKPDKTACTAEEMAKCKELGLSCTSADKSQKDVANNPACTTSTACCNERKTPEKKV